MPTSVDIPKHETRVALAGYKRKYGDWGMKMCKRTNQAFVTPGKGIPR